MSRPVNRTYSNLSRPWTWQKLIDPLKVAMLATAIYATFAGLPSLAFWLAG